MTETLSWPRKAGASMARLPDWIRLTLQGWREHGRLRRELEGLRQNDELERTLADTGLSQSDVPRLMHAHPRTPQQLADMMRRLGIRRGQLPHDAQTAGRLRAIEWRCGDCATWRQCRAWLASGEATEEYRAFCPNAAAFDELRRAETAVAGEALSESSGVVAEFPPVRGQTRGR